MTPRGLHQPSEADRTPPPCGRRLFPPEDLRRPASYPQSRSPRPPARDSLMRCPPIRIGQRSTRERAAWAASTGEARSARERSGALGALLLVGLEARCSSRQGAGMRHGLVVGCERRGFGVCGRRTRSIEALLAPAALARGRDAAAELGLHCEGQRSDGVSAHGQQFELEFGGQSVCIAEHAPSFG